MSPPRGPRRAPSWLGTLVVTVAVAVMLLRAAAALRRGVAGGSDLPPSTGIGSASPPASSRP